MTYNQNIAFAFKAVAHANPDMPAIIAEDLSVSYSKLWMIAECFAYRMREHGVDQTSIIAIDTSDMVVSVATMFAVALLGAQHVTFDPDVLRSNAVRPTHYLISPEREWFEGVPFILMDQSWSPKYAPATDNKQDALIGYTNSDAPCWIIQSSGTTGLPKYMRLSSQVVFDRVASVAEDFILNETRLFSLFDCNSRPFLIRAMAALLKACTIVDSIDITFLQQNNVNLVCGSPRQMDSWLEGAVLSPKIERLQVSGAKLSDTVTSQLLRSFKLVEDVYGSSETIKSFVNVKSMNDADVISTGKLTDSKVEIVDERDAICAPGEVGKVRIRNGYMASGYLDEPAATARSFRGGWFYPGDFATWGPMGSLQILSRTDDVINLGGQKIDLCVVDDALRSVDGVENAVCFRNPRAGKSFELTAFVVLTDITRADEYVDAAHKACVKALGQNAAPTQIIVVQDIPMTSDGIPRRVECQRLALNLN